LVTQVKNLLGGVGSKVDQSVTSALNSDTGRLVASFALSPAIGAVVLGSRQLENQGKRDNNPTMQRLGAAGAKGGFVAEGVWEGAYDLVKGTVGLAANGISTQVREGAALGSGNMGAFARAGNDFELVRGARALGRWQANIYTMPARYGVAWLTDNYAAQQSALHDSMTVQLVNSAASRVNQIRNTLTHGSEDQREQALNDLARGGGNLTVQVATLWTIAAELREAVRGGEALADARQVAGAKDEVGTATTARTLEDREAAAAALHNEALLQLRRQPPLAHLPISPEKESTLLITRNWVDDQFAGRAAETIDDHFIDGKPSAARLAFYEREIIEPAFNGRKTAAELGQRPKAFLTMGGFGSGKGVLVRRLEKLFGSGSRIVVVDPDTIRALLPEYRIQVNPRGGRTFRGAATQTHAESLYVANLMYERAIAGGYHVIIDGSGRWLPGFVRQIEELRAKGYVVYVRHADLPAEEGVRRALARRERTGRAIPEQVVRDTYAAIDENREEIQALLGPNYARFDGMNGYTPVRLASTRAPDLAALGVEPEFARTQHIVFAQAPSEVRGALAETMGGRNLVSTSGYMVPPAGYVEFVDPFLKGFSRAAGSARAGYLTSSTTDPLSIDYLTTLAAQATQSKVVYVTADDYLKYIKTESLPPEARAQFSATRKYSFPDPPAYSQATGQLPGANLVLGGRKTAVTDWMNGVRNGNRSAIVQPPIANPAWDSAKGQVDNASLYLKKMITGDYAGIDRTNPFNQEVERFIADNKAAITARVRFFGGEPEDAALKAAEWLAR
jgi:hypothetical protein